MASLKTNVKVCAPADPEEGVREFRTGVEGGMSVQLPTDTQPVVSPPASVAERYVVFTPVKVGLNVRGKAMVRELPAGVTVRPAPESVQKLLATVVAVPMVTGSQEASESWKSETVLAARL